MDRNNRCDACGSADIYVSEAGYNTCRICRACGQEEHCPSSSSEIKLRKIMGAILEGSENAPVDRYGNTLLTVRPYDLRDARRLVKPECKCGVTLTPAEAPHGRCLRCYEAQTGDPMPMPDDDEVRDHA